MPTEKELDAMAENIANYAAMGASREDVRVRARRLLGQAAAGSKGIDIPCDECGLLISHKLQCSKREQQQLKLPVKEK